MFFFFSCLQNETSSALLKPFLPSLFGIHALLLAQTDSDEKTFHGPSPLLALIKRHVQGGNNLDALGWITSLGWIYILGQDDFSASDTATGLSVLWEHCWVWFFSLFFLFFSENLRQS